MANRKELTTRIRMSFARLSLDECPERHRADILRLVQAGKELPCKYWPYARQVTPLREVLDPSYTEMKYLRLRRRYAAAARRRKAKARSEEGRSARKTARLAKRAVVVLTSQLRCSLCDYLAPSELRLKNHMGYHALAGEEV